MKLFETSFFEWVFNQFYRIGFIKKYYDKQGNHTDFDSHFWTGFILTMVAFPYGLIAALTIHIIWKEVIHDWLREKKPFNVVDFFVRLSGPVLGLIVVVLNKYV